MLSTILIPTDGSEFSDGIIAQVKQLLSQDGVQTELFCVVQASDEATLRAYREAATQHLVQRQKKLENEDGITVEWAVEVGDPAATILERIDRAQPSLVIMASHTRRGPVRWVRGSVAERVLRRSTSPLLLCNPERVASAENGYRRILIPLDGSERSTQILDLVVDIARVYGSEVVLFRSTMAHHVTLESLLSPPMEESIPTEQELLATLAPIRERLDQAGIPTRLRAAFGDPAAEILRTADEEAADLVAMTTHGRSGISRWLFGSVAEKVLRAARVPLLIKRTVSHLPEEVGGGAGT